MLRGVLRRRRRDRRSTACSPTALCATRWSRRSRRAATRSCSHRRLSSAASSPRSSRCCGRATRMKLAVVVQRLRRGDPRRRRDLRRDAGRPAVALPRRRGSDDHRARLRRVAEQTACGRLGGERRARAAASRWSAGARRRGHPEPAAASTVRLERVPCCCQEVRATRDGCAWSDALQEASSAGRAARAGAARAPACDAVRPGKWCS